MSMPAVGPGLFDASRPAKRQLYAVASVLLLAVSPFIVLPHLTERLLSTNFLPHLYCYLRTPVWCGPTSLPTASLGSRI